MPVAIRARTIEPDCSRLARFPIPDSRFPIPDSRFPIPERKTTCVPVADMSSSVQDIPRVVLDTNACLDLFVFASPRSARLRELIESGALLCVTREDCREEWRRVLRYPELKLDEARCVALEVIYDGFAIMLPDDRAAPTKLPRCRDPDDQKFLELARDAGAVALVTRDAELLVLARRVARAGLFRIVEPADIDAALEARVAPASQMP